MSTEAPLRAQPLPDRTAGEWATALSAAALARGTDYLVLTKPRIAAMVLVTVVVGYALGCGGSWNAALLIHALIGIALAAAGSSAINQYLERRTDARMPRTANRPLPAGRLRPGEVLAFGVLATVGARFKPTGMGLVDHPRPRKEGSPGRDLPPSWR